MKDKIITVDTRIIFDGEKQVFAVGCHVCEQLIEVPLLNTSEIIKKLAEFSIKHLKSCGKELN